ncbi:MAG TPA: glutamine synthetase family protein [Acetobacteraceae bacterium]|jgi:glutamine synthetase|nr:glutamine synthetase family protein [Acetobacteraceae bacterium]
MPQAAEPLVFAATCDLAGHVRGKGFPEADLAKRLRRGIGFTGSNIMMSAFGPIYETPFGTQGDLMLVPDPSTRVDVPFEGSASERFYLGDLKTTEGDHWEFCPRHFLRCALDALHALTGMTLKAAFEQEFVYTGVEERPSATYALDAFRRQDRFGELFLGAVRAAGAVPDSFLPEYGARQYEVTVGPSIGLRAADEAVIVREMARAVAWRLGHRAIFAPMLTPDGIGNGTHIHFSLVDGNGAPALHDPSGQHELSQAGVHFAAGILRHLPTLAAITAPSAASYYRLTPNRWAPTTVDLGVRDRGAALRVCPVFAAEGAADVAGQFNLEYRVADATASPYLALGAVVWAGLEGIRAQLPLPEPNGARPLPASLDAALRELAADEAARGWFGGAFHDVYLQFKRSELAQLGHATPADVCRRYAEVY